MFRAMKPVICGVGVAAATLGMATTAEAFMIFLSDTAPTSNVTASNPSLVLTEGSSGKLYVYYDPDAEGHDFINGGLGVSITSSLSGVIQFTGATVYNPQWFGGALQRWSGVEQTLGAGGNDVDALLGVSVSTAGMVTTFGAPSNGLPNTDASGEVFAFAEVDYVVTGLGATTLQLAVIDRTGSFISDENAGDLEDDANFGSALVTVVPEPVSLGLIGGGAMLLLARRRRT